MAPRTPSTTLANTQPPSTDGPSSVDQPHKIYTPSDTGITQQSRHSSAGGHSGSADDAVPTQDADIDPAPFPFRPYELARMLDPKTLDVLVNLGGSRELLRGLATDEIHGIFTEPGSKKTTRTPSVPVPGILVTSPEDGGMSESLDTGHSFPLHASLEERRRVYGANVLPDVASRSLLQVMWAALHDKVLVRRRSSSLFEPNTESSIRSCCALRLS